MTQREAKKTVCRWAWALLDSGPMPSPDGFGGGESEKDEERLSRAWEDLLDELYRRGNANRK